MATYKLVIDSKLPPVYAVDDQNPKLLDAKITHAAFSFEHKSLGLLPPVVRYISPVQKFTTYHLPGFFVLVEVPPSRRTIVFQHPDSQAALNIPVPWQYWLVSIQQNTDRKNFFVSTSDSFLAFGPRSLENDEDLFYPAFVTNVTCSDTPLNVNYPFGSICMGHHDLKLNPDTNPRFEDLFLELVSSFWASPFGIDWYQSLFAFLKLESPTHFLPTCVLEAYEKLQGLSLEDVLTLGSDDPSAYAFGYESLFSFGELTEFLEGNLSQRFSIAKTLKDLGQL